MSKYWYGRFCGVGKASQIICKLADIYIYLGNCSGYNNITSEPWLSSCLCAPMKWLHQKLPLMPYVHPLVTTLYVEVWGMTLMLGQLNALTVGEYKDSVPLLYPPFFLHNQTEASGWCILLNLYHHLKWKLSRGLCDSASASVGRVFFPQTKVSKNNHSENFPWH